MATFTSVRSPDEVIADKSLAINGGRDAAVQPIVEEDTGIVAAAAETVADIVRTRKIAHWGGGPFATRLEQAFADSIGRRFSFFHNTGTAALHSGLVALDVGSGSEVAVGSSFVAAINVIYHVGARPIFLPTDERTLLCQHDVSDWVERAPDVALLTHFLGNVLDVEAVSRSLGGGRLIEDGGQAHGALLRGSPVGSFGEIGSFAASHMKLVTAGQGGLNAQDDPEIDRKMRVFAHQGKDGRPVSEFPGHNFRGSEIGAALALAALEELPERVQGRSATRDAITRVFADAGIEFATTADGLDCVPSWFDVAIILPRRWLGHRDWLVKALLAENAPVWVYPSLIEMPWVKPWMTSMGWWGEREETLLQSETDLWSRTLVLGTQFEPPYATRCAQVIADILTGEG